ncbi:MAG: glycosyltransferase family 2 protein [Kiritimatiellae bacterium]|jgi:glycosyltransferase involved in cell wall biosynthesis|nr:glycosyltransferase family 2 protein [Kiritimatiellia bacterium]
MKISIITACFNSVAVISHAMDSILSQTWKEIEYIVVDGGSSDGTVDVIKAYEPNFNGRIRWISEADEGLYDALNKGIRMATGDVIGILNADDFLPNKDVVENIAKYFCSDNSLDAVYSDIQFVNQTCITKPTRYYSSRYFRPFMARFGYLPAHPSFYCKKEVFERLGLYKLDYKIAADHELLIRFLVKENICARYISLVSVKMRQGGISTESQESTKVINIENLKACSDNGIYSNSVMQIGRYIFKIPGVIFKNGF